MHIYEWREPHFRPVNSFYKQQGHKGKANGSDRVFVLETDSQLLGAVRLVPFEGYYWLRSLQIAQTWQRKGLGIHMLTEINQTVPENIYCFPYAHLQHFYETAGYHLIKPENCPENIRSLFSRYSGTDNKILLMARVSASAEPAALG